MDPSNITDRLIRDWLDELEGWLPIKINGVASPNVDTLLRYRYIPSSARVEGFDICNDDFPGPTKLHIILAYQIERIEVEAEYGEFRNDYLHGTIAIPVEENKELRLTEIDPLDGILDLVEMA